MIGPLTTCVVLPLALAAMAALAPARGARHLPAFCALAGSLVTFGVGLVALLDFGARPGADFRLLESMPWSTALGAAWTVGVDGIGAAMLALSGLVTAVATIQAFGERRHPRAYHALVLLLLAAVNTVFVALDLLVFYFAWEVVLLPMLCLIGLWGGEQRRYAALKFFAFTLAGSVLMLALVVAIWAAAPAEGRTVDVAPATLAMWSTDGGQTLHGLPVVRADGAAAATVHVPRDFDLRHLALQWRAFAGQGLFGWSLAGFGFLAVLLACLVKMPAVPLHTWLPHAHVQAPTAVSVLLAGVLLKLGVYGLYRVGWPLFPGEANVLAPWLGALGVVGILWGAFVALGQSDLKRLVAYSSVSHMGFCLLGLAAASTAGATGGMVQAFTHGLGSALLFLLVGVLYDRAHHRDIDGFGGLAAPMPRFSWLLLVGALAGIGLPGLSGFVGEFLVLIGGFGAEKPFPALTAAAAVSVVFSAAYLLWAVKRVAYGPLRHPAQAGFADCEPRELLAMLPLVVLIVLLGVWPAPLVDALRPSCEALLLQLRSALS